MDVPPSPEDWLNGHGSAEHFGPGAAGSTEIPGLRAALSAETWAVLDIPPEPRFLGDLVTPSSRLFLVGSTGLGKTLFAYAMAAAMATGRGFLGLKCDRPSRWLIIDGEMPTALIKQRTVDLMRRVGGIPPASIIIYSRDRAEHFASAFPALGMMQPLNTVEGQAFVLALVRAIGGVDGIIFDNVMSLIEGDQKDEIPWSETLPLVAQITALGVSQIWLDHTGHNTARQYGSATKAWRFDAVGVMSPLDGEAAPGGEVAFKLSFDSPGKTRRRTPDNWRDFEPRIVRLAEDQWTAESDGGGDKPATASKVSPAAKAFHNALLDALVVAETPGCTTRSGWFAESVRLGLLDAVLPSDSAAVQDCKRAKLRKYVTELKVAGWIGVDGEMVRNLINKAKSNG